METEYKKFESNSKSNWKKVLIFLQTPFGGVFFGTVVVSLLSLIGSFAVERVRMHNDNKETISKAKIEIEYRFLQLYTQQKYFALEDSLSKKLCDDYTDSWKQWRDEVRDFKSSPSSTKTFLCAHQEFYEINTFALMMKLADLLDGEEKNNVKEAAYELATNKYLPPYRKVNDCESYNKLILDFKKNIWISVWKQNLSNNKNRI